MSMGLGYWVGTAIFARFHDFNQHRLLASLVMGVGANANCNGHNHGCRRGVRHGRVARWPTRRSHPGEVSKQYTRDVVEPPNKNCRARSDLGPDLG